MNKNSTYTGSQVKNQFTAYLSSCIRGKRKNYLYKRLNINNKEKQVEKFLLMETGLSTEESFELKQKEKVLLHEAEGIYLKWDEISDKRLIEALLILREDERKVIYQHVFEERTFNEISFINEISAKKVKSIYYYAICKIRKMMGGD